MFRITVNNLGDVILTDLTVTDILSYQLEYRNLANHTPIFSSPNKVVWHFDELGVGESIEIQYHAETVNKCYGSNYVNVTTTEFAYDWDEIAVKVPAEGQPVMDIRKQVWDDVSGQWKDSITCILGSSLRFRVFLNSTALSISEDVNIIDTLPDYLEFSNDASHNPSFQSSNRIEWFFDEIHPGETKEIIYHAETIGEGRDDSFVYVTTSELYYDEDNLLVKVVDFPYVEVVYPKGGETLKGLANIKWIATDSHDLGLNIYIYYSKDNGDTWVFLTHVFNTEGYMWDTTHFADGSYLLKVEARDSDNLINQDTSEMFMIINDETQPHPPNKPMRPSGPSNGKVGVVNTYTSNTIDIDGDKVFYFWDWGDGTNSGWLGPYNSGEICETSHIWENKGNYEIKVKAKDINGQESEWSEPLCVSMPRNKIINPLIQLFEILLERLIIIFEKFLQPFLSILN